MIRLRCGSDTLEVLVRHTREQLEVVVDGETFRPQVEQRGPGRFFLRNGHGVEAFECVRDGDTIHLAYQGQVYRIVQEREGAARTQRHAPGGLEAPMPGKVIRVNVAVGDDVTRGAEILVVEAMKMENAVRAPRDGRIKSLAARVGDTVTPGSVLIELE